MDKREADPEYGGAEDDDIANRTEDVDAPDAETEDDVKTDVSDDDDEDLDDQGNPVVNLAKRAVAKAERERLRQQAKQKKDLLEKMRIEQNSAAQMGETDRAKHRMQFLLRQAEIFQHFAPSKDNKDPIKGKGTKGRQSKNKEDEEDAELLRDEDDEMQQAHRLPVQPSIITGGAA
ncbi:MAG: hypothetical protein WDW38_003159 [Sanguina aurantia]